MNHAAPSHPTLLAMHPHPLLRAGIASYLRAHASFDVLEDVPGRGGPDEPPIAVVIAEHHQAMQMIQTDIRAFRPSLATARILVLTSNECEVDVRRAIEAGVHGYVFLGEPLDELMEGVAVLSNGGRYLSRAVARRMAESLTRASLTPREMDVLRLLVAGECNKAIARQLDIEVGTVKTHVSTIIGKLDVTSRTQAAAVAVSRGLVEERTRTPPTSILPRPRADEHAARQTAAVR
jgi:DNA-binding NarL/FixJ family response regulator